MEVGSPYSVFFSERAIQDLDEINNYIAEQGYPDTALAYTDRIYDFCLTLAYFPHKHTLCKRIGFNRFDYRCAAFEKTYYIVFRVEKNQTVVIKRVIHGKRLASV
jgi:plasmid stabilization system protein ParE